MRQLAPNRHLCSLLFCDIRGFSGLLERLPPEEGFGYIQEFLNDLAPAILEQGGSISNLTGDGFLAEFGIQTPGPDHAVRALNGAIAVRRRLSEFNQSQHRTHHPVVTIGIGVHTGIVVSGALSFGGYQTYGLIGDAVNLAARLEKLTKEFSVDALVSEETRKLLPDDAPLIAMPAKSVPGKIGAWKSFWLKPGARPVAYRS